MQIIFHPQAAEEFSRAKRWYCDRNPQATISHACRRPGFWLRRSF